MALRKEGQGVILDSMLPHLIGIDDDILSTGIMLYHLREGSTVIGMDVEHFQPDIGKFIWRMDCRFYTIVSFSLCS